MKRVYFCYPYGDNPRERTAEIHIVIAGLHKRYPDVNFLYPHFAFPGWENEFGREFTLKCTADEVSRSDEVWIGYKPLSPGMKKDKIMAEQHNIPILDKSTEVAEIMKNVPYPLKSCS
jgi:hypothetical protein